MLSILIGTLVAAASLWGIWQWRSDFTVVVRGILPLCFFLGGVVAIIAGFSSLTRSDTDQKRSGLGKNP